MGSNIPAAQPVVTPQVDQSLVDQQAADMARKRKGRAANVLVGDADPSTLGASSLATKQLLGG